ncbi:UDP-glucuronic acid decarboxylase family protein [Lebetimonas sp. JH292]|uniref:UDP-glucuronic acid decarboxylase family protein n=1 Tax=Lebetimonas sp. JH292 TaxID=990068 RepID=UPI00046753A9|nr:UDP-glucuronic acid decarboxylase family protein [Lebetimonas sp. JH292]
MKKILIAGGAGFIGSHLCKKLLEENNEVICIDNLLTGQKNNIYNHKNYKFIKNDIINPIDIKVDEIYNLACPASPKQYFKYPIYTTKISVIGTLNLLELAYKYNAKFLQASTSEIYGDPEVHPQTEEYFGNVNTIGPRACYDEGKRCAETLCSNFKREKNINVKIVRIFNTYGPHMRADDGRVISNFIVQALTNKDITIYGDGKQTRSFCYVDDLVNGLIKMMNSNENGPINIGNPEEYSIIEVAEKIINLTNPKSKIKFLNKMEDDPKVRKPDIKKAKKLLNWQPKISFNEGLKKTIKYFKEQL